MNFYFPLDIFDGNYKAYQLDSLTHIALGACIGEIMLSKKLGKKAMLWGALAQSFPDVDFIASFLLSPTADLNAHRSLTHSFLFALLMAICLSLLARRLHRPHNIAFKTFFIFFGLQMGIHDVLDTCNAYGTALFEPFSHHRFAFNILYVIDPFFSITLLIAATALIIAKRFSRLRTTWLLFGLLPSAFYLGYSALNKLKVDRKIEQSLNVSQVKYKDYFTTPTPFNNLLWYCVAASDSGYYIGYRSVFDNSQTYTRFRFFKRNDQLIKPGEKDDLKQLLRFAGDYYTIEQNKDTLIFNVLRFGQVLGWQNPEGHFAFHYFLNEGYDNSLVVQRGRFTGWNRKTLHIFYRRIIGSIEKQQE